MKINIKKQAKILLLTGCITLTGCANKGKLVTGLTQGKAITSQESKMLDQYSVDKLWEFYQKFEKKVEKSYIEGKENRDYIDLLKEYELEDVHKKMMTAIKDNNPDSIENFYQELRNDILESVEDNNVEKMERNRMLLLPIFTTSQEIFKDSESILTDAELRDIDPQKIEEAIQKTIQYNKRNH